MSYANGIHKYVAAVEFTPGGKRYYYWHQYEDLMEGEDLRRDKSNVTIIHPYVSNGCYPSSPSARIYRYENSIKFKGEPQMEPMKDVKVAAVSFAGSRSRYHYFHNLPNLEMGNICVASIDNMQLVTVLDPDIQASNLRSQATKWLYGKVCYVKEQQQAAEEYKVRVAQKKAQQEMIERKKNKIKEALKSEGIDLEMLMFDYLIFTNPGKLPANIRAMFADLQGLVAETEQGVLL